MSNGAVSDEALLTRPNRWVPAAVLWGLGLLALAAALAVPQENSARVLLVGPVDIHGLRFLTAAATAVLVVVALCVTLITLAGLSSAAWVDAVVGTLLLLIICGCVLLLWPAVLIGALAFSDEYRTVGVVDGRELVVENGIGLGDSSLSAGYRDGVVVDFRSTGGDTLVREPGAPFERWTFRVLSSGDAVAVEYAFTPGHPAGTLLLPKP